jgi:hypothetical protein
MNSVIFQNLAATLATLESQNDTMLIVHQGILNV